jgi:hypothetical protein
MFLKMKNKLTNLNDHLFCQIERLSDECISDKELEKEICRSKAITSVSKEIINNARLVLDAQLGVADLLETKKLPGMLE